MCFRDIHFFWKIFDFWKIVNIKYKNGEMGINFQSSIMVYWIEHWTDILEVLGSNPSAAWLKLITFTKIFHFFKFFKNQKFVKKNVCFWNEFWLYQHGVKKAPWWSYSQFFRLNLILDTLYFCLKLQISLYSLML